MTTRTDSVSFASWLIGQAGRDDPIGDLVHDLNISLGLHAAAGSRGIDSPDAIRKHMTDRHAGNAALQTLDEAECEWRS